MTIQEYISQQPGIVRQSLMTLPEQIHPALPERLPNKLYLIGTGSSMNAFQAASSAFAELPTTMYLRSPLTFLAETYQRHDDGALAIVLSQSGQSGDTLAAAKQALSEAMHVIVVTAGRDTELTRLGAELIFLPVERETVGPKTMGYTASVIAAQLIAMAIAEESPALVPDAFVDDYTNLIETTRLWSLDALPIFDSVDAMVVLGQGRHLGSAQEGSLKIAEMTGIPAFGLETEEASHGRLQGLTLRSRTIVLAATPGELEFANRIGHAMTGCGLHSLIFDLTGSSASAGTPRFNVRGLGTKRFSVDTLTAVLPFQWLAVRLAESRGMKPERMTYPQMSAMMGIKLDEVSD